MKGAVRNLFRRFTSVFLAAAITVPMLYGISFPAAKASAAQPFAKTVSNTQLGANGFAKPVVPETKDSPWQGSYLYYGEYNGSPVRYRILDFYTQKYKEDGRTIFLDCDTGLFFHTYDGSLDDNSGSSIWGESDLREYLNGEYINDFANFTDSERNAIVASSIEGGRDLSGINMDAMGRYKKYVGLNGDKLFLLDIEDVLNPQYGYYDAEYNEDGAMNHGKIGPRGLSGSWWLRSQDIQDDKDFGLQDFFAGTANSRYSYSGWQPNEAYAAVSPAMNINSESVLFSSAISGSFGAVGTEYKLTLIDENLSITPRNIQRNGNQVSFKGIVGGFDEANPPRISYFITEDGWNYGTLFGKPQNMLAYGEVTKNGDLYSFTIPSSVSGSWNEDYCIYIIAEDINGKYETDYASRPVFLDTPATFGKSAENTFLSAWEISSPSYDYDVNDYKRSIIWYGKYNGQPVAYRLVGRDAATQTILLDSDEVLFRMSFNPDSDMVNGDVWEYSQLRVALNGSAFLDKPGVFTNAEKSAIYSHYDTGDSPFTGAAGQADLPFASQVGLNGEKIFILDVQDIYNSSSGYFRSNRFYGSKHTAYDDGTTSWWLRNGAGIRTVDVLGTGEVTGHTAGIMESDGRSIGYDIVSELNGVSPAMYLLTERVLFSTAVNGTLRDKNTEYKLTVIDPEIKLSVSNATLNGRKLSFDYSLFGEDKDQVTQFSYLITRLPYTPGEYDNAIIAYGQIPVLGSSRVPRLSFNIPDNLPGSFGSDYYVYILAEDINGMYETDCSCEPVKVNLILQEYFDGKNSSNTRLGTRYLASPAVPESEDSFWTGDYIYFGNYDYFPMKFRVLDKNSDLGSGNGILLQSDYAQLMLPFNDTPTTCDWADSTLKAKLNGEEFLEKQGVFTEVEKESILQTDDPSRPHVSSVIDEVLGTTGYVGLDGEKIFVLDAEDLMNEEYGYCNAILDPSKETKIVSDFPQIWIQTQRVSATQITLPWTRNGLGYTDYENGDRMYWGLLYGFRSSKRGFLGEQINLNHSVSPAFVLDSDSVIMMSSVFGKLSNSYGRAFVLTLHDPEIKLETDAFSQIGDKVEFNYQVSGANASNVNQLSYVITETGTFGKVDELKYYGQVTVSGDILGQTKGSFYLPAEYADKVWGKDFKVFILAEEITDRYETDYASELTELKPENMVVLFDLTGGGKKRLNQSQLEAITCLANNKKISIKTDGNGMLIDLDKDDEATDDLKITRQGNTYYIEKLSTCSTGARVLFTDKDTGYAFASIAFIIPIKTPKNEPRFDRHALRLSDEIGVRFGVSFPDNLILTGCYVDFVSSDGRTLTVTIDEAEKDTSDPSANRYYFMFNINALEIQDTITAELHYNSKSTVKDTYCALDYIHAIQDDPELYGEKNVALVNALLDYGYYFQRSGWKDNGEHITIAEPSKHLEDSDMFDTADLLEDYTMTKELGQSGIEKVQVALTLNSRTELKIYVKLADGVTMVTSGYTTAQLNGVQYYVFSISNIGPKNLGKTYTKSIETSSGVAEISASAMYYANALMNSYTLNEKQMLAMSSYYNYYMAAYNY